MTHPPFDPTVRPGEGPNAEVANNMRLPGIKKTTAKAVNLVMQVERNANPVEMISVNFELLLKIILYWSRVMHYHLLMINCSSDPPTI